MAEQITKMTRKKNVPRWVAITGILLIGTICFLRFLDVRATRAAYKRGKDLVEWGQPARAISYLETAKRRSPKDLLIRRELFQAYRESKEYEKALQLASDSYRLARTKSEHREWLGAIAIASLRTGALVEAEKIAQQILLSSPNDAGGYVFLLEARQMQGQHAEAIKYGQRAFELINSPLGRRPKLMISTRVAYSYIMLKSYDTATQTILDAINLVSDQERTAAKATWQPSPDRPLKALQACIEDIKGDRGSAEKTWRQVVESSRKVKEDALLAFAQRRLSAQETGIPLDTKALPSIGVFVEQLES